MLTPCDKDDFAGKVWDVLVGIEMKIGHDVGMMRLRIKWDIDRIEYY